MDTASTCAFSADILCCRRADKSIRAKETFRKKVRYLCNLLATSA